MDAPMSDIAKIMASKDLLFNDECKTEEKFAHEILEEEYLSNYKPYKN